MSDLPTGTVTFLFTDIEGSTRRWQRDPAMSSALARHDEIVREGVASHRGYLLRHTGDGVVAVFPSATEAVQAAVDVQQALGEEEWDGDPLRVRMAVHTGEAEERDGYYFGPAPNLAARLMAVAHGGQILVSLPSAELIRDHMPASVGLVDMGEHRLRDIDRPERIFQVVGDALRRNFPPLRVADRRLRAFGAEHRRGGGLPSPIAGLMGRDAEIESISKALKRLRLLTLTGAGGVGKTALAVGVTHHLVDEYPDGVRFVDLARIGDPTLVAREVACVLGAGNRKAEWTEAALAVLEDTSTLVVIDNCEHVIDSVADLAHQLLSANQGLRLLATSREPLGVPGEAIQKVSPPALDDAVKLLRERASAAGADLEAEDPEDLAALCERLDRLPLALELVASRLRHLSVGDIMERLDDRFALLADGPRTGLPRHRTLEAAMEWSYELLDDEERRHFRRLSLFPGGFTLDTAEAMCEEKALTVVASLVDKSLVSVDSRAEGLRYRMLETIRSYGLRKLRERGEETEALDAQLAWASRLAAEARRGLAGPEEPSWIAILDVELDNLRAAMEWAIERPDPTKGLHIFGALHEYWDVRAIREGHWWSDRLLGIADETVDDQVLAWALTTAGLLEARMGDHTRSREHLRRARGLFTELGNPAGAALAEIIEAFFAESHESDWQAVLVEALGAIRAHGDMNYLAAGLTWACGLTLGRGEWGLFGELVGELDHTLSTVGQTRAVAHLDECRAVLLMREGDHPGAAAALVDALDAYETVRSRLCVAHCLVRAADWLMREGQRRTVAILLGSVAQSIEESGWSWPELYQLNQFRFLQDELPEQWEEGRRWKLPEAVEHFRAVVAE